MPTLQPQTIAALRDAVSTAAPACVDAIVTEVPGYHRGFDARLRQNIESAVEQALTTFLDLQAGSTPGSYPSILHGAEELGKGEALSGRSTDALLTAYRVGARVAWQSFSTQALRCHEDAAAVAELAARTFTFIDELSAASLAGHTEALTRRTHELTRRRDQLTAALVAGENRVTLERLADHARWRLPTTLTALVLRCEPSQQLTTTLGPDALWHTPTPESSIVLVGDAGTAARAEILRAAAGLELSLGPRVPWLEAAESVRRAHRLLDIVESTEPLDCEEHLPELLLDADPRMSARLTEQALAPLADLTDAKRDVLTETLLSWLLHQGRRDDVAGELHVHPQTVRYRMGQLRELYGDSLNEPRRVLEIILGLVAATMNREGHQP